MTEPQDARHMLDLAERAATGGDLASAAELLRGAARIQEEELGPLHPELANTLNNLAIVTEKTGSQTEAETLYRRAAAIAAAALPSDHPMVVASRQNLEDFCRARGLSLDAPVAVTPSRDIEREPEQAPVQPVKTGSTAKAATAPSTPPRPNPDAPAAIATQRLPPAPTAGKASHSDQWVAAAAVVLVAAVLLVLRPWSSREAPLPAPTPEPRAAAPQPAEATPPQTVAPPATPAPVEPAEPPTAAPPREQRDVVTDKSPAAGGITLITAQLCRNFSTSGSSWRCDAVGQSAAPGPMVLYTRVKSARDTTLVHRWYHGSTLRQSVTLRIRANATEGYRTFSRLTVDDGDWRLEVRSPDGNLLHEQQFAVR